MTQRKKTTPEEVAEKVRDTVFAFEEYRTERGERVIVEKWGLRPGIIMAKRIADLFEKFNAMGIAQATTGDFVQHGYEILYDVVRDTIRWSDADMERLSLEDFQNLVEVVQRVCLTSGESEDATGTAGKLTGFIGVWVLPAKTAASLSVRSAPSSVTGTDSETSQTGTPPS